MAVACEGHNGCVITWRAQDSETFERIAFLLAQRVHAATGWDVQRIDGRGGDDGVDILAQGPDGEYVVYQLKFFPEGIAISNRKAQVRRSLKKAAISHPQMTDWVLVIPCSLTLPQTQWLRDLPHDKTTARVTFWDESQLDALLTQFPDVYAYARRDISLMESAKLLGQEQAILANPAEDIPARLTALRDLANTVDANFRANLYADDDGVRVTATAKHASAKQTLNTKFAFPKGYEHHLEELLELVNHGITEDVVLPPEVIVSVEQRGPTFLIDPPNDSRQKLTFHTEAQPELITVRVLDEDGEALGIHPGTVRITGGTLGIKLTAVFHETLHITWRVNLVEPQPSPATRFTLTPEGQTCSNVIAACRLLRQILSHKHLEIDVRGTRNGMVTRDAPTDLPGHAAVVLEIAEDLEAVQRATDTYFPYPSIATPTDRVHLRVCRMLAQGRSAMAPTTSRVNIRLTHRPEDPTEPGPISLDGQSMVFPFAGREFVLRDITIWHPNAWLKAAEDDSDSSPHYVLEPANERFILSPDNALAPPRAWDLTGIREPDVPPIPEGIHLSNGVGFSAAIWRIRQRDLANPLIRGLPPTAPERP